jgi:predicted nucleotidyltransferase
MVRDGAIINLVNEIAKKVHQEFGGDALVIWFGSWVTGNTHPNSDIDLAIAPPLIQHRLGKLE